MFPNRADRWAEEGNICQFGITEAVGGVLAGALTSAGIGAGAAGVIGTGLAGAGLGAAAGSGLSAIEGKPIGEGALFGGLTGGAISAAGPAIAGVLESAGLSTGTATAVGDVAAGAGGGLLGSVATGQSPLTGVIEGGGAGLVSGIAGTPGQTAGSATPGTTVSPTAGGTGGAGGAAAPGPVSLPASGGGATPVDLTSSGTLDNLGISAGGGAPGVAAGITPSAATDASLFNPGGVPQGVFNPGGFGAPAAATSGGGSGFNLDHILGMIGQNPGLLLGAGALGADVLMGNKPLPAQTSVQNAATSAGSVGTTLSSYALSGTLPAGLQQIVDSNTNAGIAQVRSTYANLGLSGSTMETQAINQIKDASAGQTAQLANQLLQQGASFTGLSDQELNTLLQTQLQQETGLQAAIGNFAGALAGARTRTSTSA